MPTRAAEIVAAMETNLDKVPLSAAEPIELAASCKQAEVQVLFKDAFLQWKESLNRWFLPHFLGGMGLFILMAYATAGSLFATWHGLLKWLGIVVVLCCYGFVAFGYCLFTSCLLALRLACVHWDDFIDKILSLVQERVAGKIADMNVGLSKPEATHLVRASVRDVFASVKQTQTGIPRGLVLICLGLLAMAVRFVLSAKIMKWSSRTVKLGKLFAGKATLVGAIFLNLHVLATLLLVVCYALGIALVISNIYFVFFLK